MILIVNILIGPFNLPLFFVIRSSSFNLLGKIPMIKIENLVILSTWTELIEK